MALKTRLGKADYDALEESLKSHYVADGDSYKLDADYEDVTGLKAKNAELLAELKKRSDIVKQFEGLDAEEAKNALAQLSKIEEDKLLSKQKFDEVLAKRTKEFEEKLAAAEQRNKQLFDTQAERDLHLALAKNGVRSDKIEDAAIVLRAKHIKAVEDGGKPVWRSMDDTETHDLDKFISGLTTSKADWFEARTQTGGGASGSGNNGGVKQDANLPPTARLEQLFSSGK